MTPVKTVVSNLKVKLWDGMSTDDRTLWGLTIIALFRQFMGGVLGKVWFFGLPFNPWKLWGQAVGSTMFIVIIAHVTKIRELKFVAWVLLVAFIGLSTLV